MSIKRTTTERKIAEELAKCIRMAGTAIINNMQNAGEAGLSEARAYNGKAYKDNTCNLRSSNGYVISHCGRIITPLNIFAPISQKSEEGARKGAEYAKQLAESIVKPYALLLVTGMEYASYVSDKGYNVNDTAIDEASETFKRLMEKTFKK